jgi:hypothetical protein
VTVLLMFAVIFGMYAVITAVTVIAMVVVRLFAGRILAGAPDPVPPDDDPGFAEYEAEEGRQQP